MRELMEEMSTNDGGVLVSLPFRERFLCVFRFSHWFPKRSSRRSEKKWSSRTKAHCSGSQKNARSNNEPTTTPMKSKTEGCSTKKAKEDVQPNQQEQPGCSTKKAKEDLHPNQQEQPGCSTKKAKEGVHLNQQEQPACSTKKAKEDVHPIQQEQPGCSTKKAKEDVHLNQQGQQQHISTISDPVVVTNSGRSSLPVGEELAKGGVCGNGSPTFIRLSSQSLSKLRNQYARAMLKVGDMSGSVSAGTSVSFESQVFESEEILRRSQVDNEMMNFYLHSGIQPSEWKDAHMGSRIIRNGVISV